MNILSQGWLSSRGIIHWVPVCRGTPSQGTSVQGSVPSLPSLGTPRDSSKREVYKGFDGCPGAPKGVGGRGKNIRNVPNYLFPVSIHGSSFLAAWVPPIVQNKKLLSFSRVFVIGQEPHGCVHKCFSECLVAYVKWPGVINSPLNFATCVLPKIILGVLL